MDGPLIRAVRPPFARAKARKPVTPAAGEAERLRAVGWTEEQIAAGRRRVAQPCRRCGGSGYLAGFRHVDGGRCFRCRAAGVDPTFAVEYAPSVRAKLDERAARRCESKQARLHAAFDGWFAQRPELVAAWNRADADLRGWEAWGAQFDAMAEGQAARPHTPLAWDPFLSELTRQLRRREQLSDQQAAFYVRRVAEVARQDQQERERQARQVAAPEGLVTFAGTVAAVRSQPGYMDRPEVKMLVIAQAPDGGEFRVWCTVPRRGGPCREGDRITLTAALQRSERDPSFAIGKHPRLGIPSELR